MIRADVAVVGAGPAGAATALAAAGAGLRVVLVDRAEFPRDKVCGDGLTTGALRRLDRLGLDPTSLPSWQPVDEVNIRIADGRHASLSLPEANRAGPGPTYAATVRRAELDAAMVEMCRRAGIAVHEGRGLADARPGAGGEGVEIDLDDGEVVRAWYAIGADGMWSPLRKALGAGDHGPGGSTYLGEWHAVRQYVSGVSEEARNLWVWFEDDIRPGYVWSFPLPGGRANIGFGVRREPGTSTGRLKEQWQDLLARPHIASVIGAGATEEGPVKSWPIPARLGRTRLAALDGRVLFVGDAARASDCMTGEGIAQALETGELAARTVAAWGPDAPMRAAASYRSSLRRGMVVDEMVSNLFSRVLSSRRGARAWFDIANATTRSRRHFTRWMFEDYARAMPVTPWRWRPGTLHQPGAFGGRPA